MFTHVTFLPPAQEWFSGLMPYRKLLVSQIVIILFYGWICLDFLRGHGRFVSLSLGAAEGFLLFGALYLGAMIVRYIVRMFLYPRERWVGGCIPIFFHWVLSSFLLSIGLYNWETYPGARLGFPALLVVATAALGVLFWVLYLVMPSLVGRSMGFGRAEYAVRPEKNLALADGTSGSPVVDVYHPYRRVHTPTLILQVGSINGKKEALRLGIVAKMLAERGYTVVVGLSSEETNQDAPWMQALVARQSWFDGTAALWEALTVERLYQDLRSKRLQPNPGLRLTE